MPDEFTKFIDECNNLVKIFGKNDFNLSNSEKNIENLPVEFQ